MNGRNRPFEIIALIAGAVFVISFGLSGIANAVIWVTCGSTPSDAKMFSGITFAIGGAAEVLGRVDQCDVPTAAIRITMLTVVVVFVGLVAAGLVAYLRFRQSDRYFRFQLLYRDGFAKRSEVKANLSSEALAKHAQALRPGLKRPTAEDAGVRVGESRGIPVYVSAEDSVCLAAAPRSGKGYRIIIGAILDWNGPLITTSTRNDNLAATMTARAKRGTVTVFDPQGLSGVESTLRVSPVRGCEDPLVAEQRARAIVSGSALGQSQSNQEWASASGSLLAALLHAAALSGLGVTALRDWSANPALTAPAIAVLQENGASGWAAALEAVVRGDEKLLASSWFGVSGAMRPLMIPTVFDAMNPAPGEEFDVDDFLNGQNTLYLIGTGAGAGAVGGFLGAVLDDVVEVARRKALASQGSRLDPPLALVLDEIANMFSWTALPTVLSDGGGIGIFTMVVLQSMSQAVTSWSQAEADTIWNSSIVKILLGGSGDVKHMKDISNLLGERQVVLQNASYSDTNTTHSSQKTKVPVLTVDELRRLPVGMGLLAYRNRRGVLMDVRGWTERNDARLISAGKRRTEASQLAVFKERYRDKGTQDV